MTVHHGKFRPDSPWCDCGQGEGCTCAAPEIRVNGVLLDVKPETGTIDLPPATSITEYLRWQGARLDPARHLHVMRSQPAPDPAPSSLPEDSYWIES